MKYFTGLTVAALSLSLLAGPTLAGSLKRIRKEADFVAQVAGRTLTNDHGKIVIRADGTLSGKYNGESYTGAWKWSKNYWCRNAKLGNKSIGTNCHVIRVGGDQLLLIRDKGKGRETTMTIN